MTLTLDAAQTIIAAALAKGRALGLKPLCVVVTDVGGATIAAAREDGASPMRPKIAHGKAFGAVAMGLNSRALYERAKKDPWFIQAMNALADGALVPSPGGVLIRGGEGIVGAVGITGDTGDNDEICAIAGIEAAGFAPEKS